MLRDASAASAGGSGSTSASETLPRRRTADGRRASRWGISKADVSATSAAEVVAEKADAPTAGDAENALLVRQMWLHFAACATHDLRVVMARGVGKHPIYALLPLPSERNNIWQRLRRAVIMLYG